MSLEANVKSVRVDLAVRVDLGSKPKYIPSIPKSKNQQKSLS